MHELEGLLQAVKADGVIAPEETARIQRWLDHAETLPTRAPFTELLSVVRAVLQDRVVTLDEIEDILFVTAKLTTVNPYFDSMRTGLQQLHGLLAGVVADKAVVHSEADAIV